MAAPTAPNSDWHWTPDSTTAFSGTAGIDENILGFIDSAGQWLQIDHNAVKLYWSDDDGATWNDAGSIPLNGDMNSPGSFFLDYVNDYLFIVGELTSIDDSNCVVDKWDPVNHTLTYKDTVLLVNAGTGGNWSNSPIADLTETNPILLWPYAQAGSVEWATIKFTVSTETLSLEGTDGVALRDGNKGFFINPDSTGHRFELTDYANDTVYWVGPDSSANVGWWEVTHNGTNFRDSDNDSGFYNAADVHRTCFPYVDDDNKMWIAIGDQSNLDFKIIKSDSALPLQGGAGATTWTEIASYNTDDGTITTMNNCQYAAIYADENGKFHFIFLHETADDFDWVYITYDTGTDAWTTTELGFADSDFDGNPTPEVSMVFPYDPVNDSQYLAFLPTSDYVDSNIYGAWYVIPVAGGASGVGWGFIPIGV